MPVKSLNIPSSSAQVEQVACDLPQAQMFDRNVVGPGNAPSRVIDNVQDMKVSDLFKPSRQVQ